MKKSIIFVLLLSYLSIASFAQTISGTVFGLENGRKQPLPGVNIFWQNTPRTGTATNQSGEFTIRKNNTQHMLVVSFVGFKRQVIHIDGNNPIEVVLEADNTIEEVTVIQKDRGTYLSTIDPVHVERIGGAELHKAACCNLAESFETNPSIDVSYNDAISGAKQIRLLGLDGIYSQLQSENIPNFRGLATNFGLTYIPGPWMDNIQVSKGAASVVNGYDAISGQINVDFKKPDSQEKLHLNGFASADGKLEFNANTNIRLDKEKLTTGIFVHAENLSNKIDHNGDGFLDHPVNSQFHLYNVWKLNNLKGLMVHGAWRFLKDERTGGQTTFNRQMARTIQNPYGIGMNNTMAEGIFKIGKVFNQNHSALALLSNAVFHDMTSFYGLHNYDGRETRFYTNLVFSHDFDDLSVHSINTGFSWVYDHFDEKLHNRAMKRYESVPGVFAEYTFKPSEKLTLMTGLRADWHNLFGVFYTPRAHVRYQPDPRFTFRVSAGKGYRTANVLAESSHLLSTSRNLIFDETMQEKAWNYGFSFIQKYQVGSREMQITTEFYRTHFDNQLVLDRETSADAIFLKPLDGKSFANSFQIDLRWPVVKNLDVTLAYRKNDVKQTIGGTLVEKPLLSRYKGLFSTNYTTRLKKWMFDYTLQLNGGGRLPHIAGSGTMATAVKHEFSPYTVMNAQITRYFRLWSIYLGAENLTDYMQHMPVLGSENPFAQGFDATQIWGPVSGRRIYAGLRFTLEYK